MQQISIRFSVMLSIQLSFPAASIRKQYPRARSAIVHGPIVIIQLTEIDGTHPVLSLESERKSDTRDSSTEITRSLKEEMRIV
jgi:hypothetical protein